MRHPSSIEFGLLGSGFGNWSAIEGCRIQKVDVWYVLCTVVKLQLDTILMQEIRIKILDRKYRLGLAGPRVATDDRRKRPCDRPLTVLRLSE